jgi:hypothetical protein
VLSSAGQSDSFIDTLDRFWRVYSNVPTFSSLDYGNIYALFRDNITASWEDTFNENGFSVILYMNKYIPNEYMTKLYQNALFMVIGSNCSFSDGLNGCTFERKIGGNKIAFWMGTALSTIKEQLEVAYAVLKAFEIPFSDITLIDEELRIDWKDPKNAARKITVKCISHKKRVSDPLPPRNRSRPSVGATTGQSSGGPRGNGPPRDGRNGPPRNGPPRDGPSTRPTGRQSHTTVPAVSAVPVVRTAPTVPAVPVNAWTTGKRF